ncbi:MAG: N-6 DNA methylase [Clostridia bacterium]|nr:N-6 DNA methylase [Clostridia bacterium]
MKQKLTLLKTRLRALYTDEEEVFRRYVDGIFEMYNDVWDISDAYSFYYSEDRASINLDKQCHSRVNAEKVHIATQFFTPRWLVKYVAENSLGRFFPNVSMDYRDGNYTLVEPAALKVFDPAVGTGNMLLYAYDLLEKVYKERGFSTQQIPHKILSSFFGLDIDKRAVGVAKRLLLKRSGLENFDFNIFSFDEIDAGLIDKCYACGLNRLGDFISFLTKNKHLGSIVRPYTDMAKDLAALKSSSDGALTLDALEILTMQFDAILVNPPYLASSDYDGALCEYVFQNYLPYKQDLFAVFIARCFEYLIEGGALGAVCPYNWMFIKSFEGMRKLIIKKGLLNLTQLSTGGYSKAVVYLSAFTALQVKPPKSVFIRLTDFKAADQQIRLKNAINNNVAYRYEKAQELFNETPSKALTYWLSPRAIKNFDGDRLCDYLEIRQGMATGDNKTFLRKIDTVDATDIAFDAESIEHFDRLNKKYALYNKGGVYRKWFGNIDYVIRFDAASRKILACQGNKMPSREYYFKECITWTLVSSKGHFGARYSNHSVFDVGGSCGFVKPGSPVGIYVILGFLCSKCATYYLNALNPTLNVQVGDLKNLPFIVPTTAQIEEIEALVKENIVIARNDWYNKSAADGFEKMRRNEERLNTMFIELYGLAQELDCIVDKKLITIRRHNEK